MEFVRERSWYAKGKLAASSLPARCLLTPTCTTSAKRQFFRGWLILTYTLMIRGEASGKDLRRQRELPLRAATRCWWICRSIVCRQQLTWRRSMRNEKRRRGSAGWIGRRGAV